MYNNYIEILVFKDLCIKGLMFVVILDLVWFFYFYKDF